MFAAVRPVKFTVFNYDVNMDLPYKIKIHMLKTNEFIHVSMLCVDQNLLTTHGQV